jgi:3',5'-cyclic AMP phosphodiesterase CpdA
MSLLFHLSDLHFGPKFNSHLSELILQDLLESEPDLTILSGDFTMRARVNEYEEARAYIAKLPKPILTIPGNHDQPLHASGIPERLTNPWGRYKTYINENVETSFEGTDVFVVGANSNHPIVPGGIWSSAQRAFVEREFTRAPQGLCKIFVTHHHVEWNGKYRPFGTWFPTTQLNWLKGLGVELILNGHTHVPLTIQSAQGIVIAQAGTSMSGRVRHGQGNAYNRIRVEHDSLTVQVMAYDTGSDKFVQSAEKTFSRMRRQETGA